MQKRNDESSNARSSTAGNVSGTGIDRHDALAAQGEPGAKRRRIAIACSACRIRKSRCNGDRPRCDTCERLGFECAYEVPDTAVNMIIPKDLFATLEERVKTMEQTIAQHDARIAATENARRHGRTNSDTWSKSADRPALIMTPGTAISVNLQDTREQQDESGTTDGMAIALVDEDDCAFFGPSSNISFMRHILAALSRKSRTGDGASASQLGDNASLHDQGILSAAKPCSPVSVADRYISREAGLDANILPPDHEVETLLSAYFSNTGLLFPFIHEQSFLETYYELKSRGFLTPVRRTWLGLLNMILAMATSTADQSSATSPGRRTSSNVFYRQAQKLCKSQMLRGTTLETVQYLLITSQYLQGTQNSLQTWTTHGLAVKAALSIGLHSNDILKNFTPFEQEMRKRTWYGCILLDRTLSMTFGRPCSIPQEYIRVDIPSPTGDPRADISVAFYNATISLYEVLWKIIANLYGQNLGYEKTTSDTSVVTQILQLSHELSEWQASLPSPLSLTSASILETIADAPDDPIKERYRLILTLRHLNIQLLLHRPILTRSLDNAPSTTKSSPRNPFNQMERNFNLVCTQSAEEIIAIVLTVLTRKSLGRHLIGAWWFTLYYIFNAALAVFGSLLAPLDDDLTAESCSPSRLNRGRQFLQDAINALVLLEKGNTVIERCIDYLRYLLKLVDGWIAVPPPNGTDTNSEIRGVNDVVRAGQTGTDSGGLQALLGDAMSQSADDGMDDLELGPFFANDFQRWFDSPTSRN